MALGPTEWIGTVKPQVIEITSPLSHAKMSRDTLLVTSSELCDPIGDRLALG